MSFPQVLTGVAHIGIPTNDLDKTIAFYKKLGFVSALETVNKAAGERVAFLQLGDLMIETYENHRAAEKAGAIDHVALATTDIEAAFAAAKEAGMHLLHSSIQSLPFWENGVRFFMVEGPNKERIYQLGTLDEHASAEDLLSVVTEFIEEFKAKYGDHVHVLDWALHLDESTPHIHERHVFDCENKYGEVAPQQEKALEALGFDLPDPDKPLSRRNNRKIIFDAACRKMLFEIAKRHGLELEEEAEYGNRKYLEKQDFILAKQKEQLAAQQSKLDELTLKVSEMETLLEDVSAAAYDKAVEVVTDVVRTETRKEDMRMIEDTKKWVLSPERKAPQATREYAAHRLDTVLDKFLKTMQTTAATSAGEAPEAGSPSERQGADQGESTGFRSATAEPLTGRTGAKQTNGATPQTGGALGNLNSSGTFGAESWHFLPRHPVTRKRRSAYEYESA